MLSGDIFVLTAQKNTNSGNLSKVKLYLTAQIAFSGFSEDTKMDVVLIESRSDFDMDCQTITITKPVKDGLCKWVTMYVKDWLYCFSRGCD